MTWYVQQGAETVKIFDRFDMSGNGNIRFSGTIETALSMFAFVMQENDELRKAVADATIEIERLKTQPVR